MRYQYKAGRLHELPEMEKPKNDFPMNTRTQTPIYVNKLKDYEAHLTSLKNYPVTGTGWTEDKVYEGNEVELRWANPHCPNGHKFEKSENDEYQVAHLAQNESEDEIWNEVNSYYKEIHDDRTGFKERVELKRELKSKYSITRKQ